MARLFKNSFLTVEQQIELLQLIITTSNEETRARKPRLVCLKSIIQTLSEEKPELLNKGLVHQILGNKLTSR